MRMWQELPEENPGQVGMICSTVRSEYLEDDNGVCVLLEDDNGVCVLLL